jgi:endonuclease YncB( thermonuclease family)
MSATDRTIPMSKPQQFDNWPESIQPGYGPYRAVCERIVDGDTLFVLCDLGLNQYSYQSLRLEDVFAPELFSGTSREAGAEAREYLSSICAPGTKLQMYTQKDASTFGRYVATLKMADGTVVNEAMREWLEEKGYTGGTGA